MPLPSNFLMPVLGLVVVGAIVASERVTSRAEPPGRIRVTYWEKWTGFEYEGMRSIVDDFNASQDRIFVEILPISSIDQKTMMATSAGIPPDVAGLFGPNVPQYVDDQAILPLDDFCREAGIRESQYIPAYWRIATYKGRIYALPSTPASTALHYNKDLLKQAGLDPERPPRTIEELDEYAAKITKRQGGAIDVAGFMHAEPGWWNWGWPHFFGGRLWDGKDRITANEPPNVKAFEWIRSYSQRYGPGDLQTFRSGFGNFSSPQNAFMTSKVAMEIQGVWMYNFIHQYAPSLNWGAAPFPHPQDRPDLAETTFVDMDVLVIPRGARHPREAFEFIKYVQSQKAMEKLCLSHQKNSPLIEVSEDFWRQHKNPYIRLFDRLAKSKNAVSTPRVGIWSEYSAELTSAFEEVALLRKTPQQAMDDVVARMQPKLDQYLFRLKAREAARK